MNSYPATLLPYYPTTPIHCIDEIIITLWSKHLELELIVGSNSIGMQQNLEIIAAVIDFWEEQLSEINDYEIQQRRLDSYKHR